MDAFEHLIGSLFEQKGYWVKYGMKVNLTKAEKVAIGRASSPRWEIDIVAYNPKADKILAIECKSYLDSRGVSCKSFTEESQKGDRYKLFNDSKLRETVFGRLKSEMQEAGLCKSSATVELYLVAGKVASEADRRELESLFSRKGWTFCSDEWIRNELLNLSKSKYEDNIATVTAKILLRS